MSHTFWYVGDAEPETIERGADARFHIICFCNYILRNLVICHQRHRDLVDDGSGVAATAGRVALRLAAPAPGPPRRETRECKWGAGQAERARASRARARE